MKFEIYLDTARSYRWRLKAANGLKIADGSEGYSTKQACLNGISLVKGNAASASVIELV